MKIVAVGACPVWQQQTTCVGERKVMEAWLVGGCGLRALMRMLVLLTS